MKIVRFFRKIKKYLNPYDPSVEVLIFKKNLLHNLEEYCRKYPKLKFAPVLKSNAYGHGLVQIAQILDKKKVSFFVLDSLYEAMILRNEGIRSEILIIGYTQLENIRKTKLKNIAFTITSLEQLQMMEEENKKTKIHLKIDTGMHRQGILPEQINEAIEIIKRSRHLYLEGICSHFADADNSDETFTKDQIKKWKDIVLIFQQNFSTIKFIHIAATAGTFYSEQSEGNVARLGLGLYGINPHPLETLDLKPVLRMQSIISSVKTIQIGEHVGYGASFEAQQKMQIATVPVGYFEGIDRRLSNCGSFKIGETFCPIVGRVSMNITSINITSTPKVKLDGQVTIFSENPGDANSIENIAKLAQTIPWEILVHIPQHLRRIVV